MMDWDAIFSEIEAWSPATNQDVEAFHQKWLSKKGYLQGLYPQIKTLPNEEKKAFGERVNTLKNKLEERYAEAKAQYNKEVSNAYITNDPSMPAAAMPQGTLHPLTIVRRKVEDIFAAIGFSARSGPEIVDSFQNFDALNIPEHHPARDMQDTFFISSDPDYVLRTHTSSVQIQTMMSTQPPIRIVAPGRVFRKDSDATHSPVFHQIEGLYIDEKVSFADLKQSLFYFVQHFFGEGTEVRFRPSFFPFTEPSAEMDIRFKKYDHSTGELVDSWMEILGCGMVHPAVLENCGIDPTKYTGYAFGIGIERLAMIQYGVQDIRAFYENDMRFLQQFALQ